MSLCVPFLVFKAEDLAAFGRITDPHAVCFNAEI